MDTYWTDSSQDSSADITSPTPDTVIARFTFPQSPADTSSSVSPLLQHESPQPRPSTEARQLGSPQRTSRRSSGRYNRLFEQTLPAKEDHPLIGSVDVHSSGGVSPELSRSLLYKASIPLPASPERMSSRRTYTTRRTANRHGPSFKSVSHFRTSPVQTVSHPRIPLSTSLKTPPAHISRLPAPTMSPTKISMPSSHLISTSTSSTTQYFEKEVGSESGELFRTRSPSSATLSPPRLIGVPERRVTHQSELSCFGLEDNATSEEHEQIEIPWFHGEFTQTSSSSSPTPQQEIREPRKNIHLKLLQSPRRQSRRSMAGYTDLLEYTVLAKDSSDDGDAYSRPLATSRTESCDDGDTLSRPLVTSRTEIDPFLVGPLVVQMALRENQRLDDELKGNAKSMYWLERLDQPCPCDVRHHPSWWSLETIDNVHRYSFLLDCRDLELKTERVIAGNSRNTVVVYDVPMENGHPWKMKTEQVLRYVDVETGVGDQTAYNVHYYNQPCDRKVFLVISSRRVMGLVVAEPQKTAHRVLHETQSYRDLEEQAVPVRVGINRLWVHISMRRLHLATLLCRLVRQLFYEGERLNMEDLAFNNVSDAGVAFAKIFLKTFKVPLYDGKTGIIPRTISSI